MGQSEKEKKNPRRTSLGQERSRRILVVEDNQDVQKALSSVLYFLGFEVALAGNGIEALATFIESPFDLVLTDLQMPAMDGLSLASHIKEKSPSTPVILLTGSDRATVRKKVERGPVDSVLFKPFRVEDLQRTVQGALASREGEHESVWEGYGG